MDNSTELPDVEAISLEECATLLNEYQGKAQNRADMSEKELRFAIQLMIRIRGTTSAAAAQRRGRDPGPAPNLSDF